VGKNDNSGREKFSLSSSCRSTGEFDERRQSPGRRKASLFKEFSQKIRNSHEHCLSCLYGTGTKRSCPPGILTGCIQGQYLEGGYLNKQKEVSLSPEKQ